MNTTAPDANGECMRIACKRTSADVLTNAASQSACGMDHCARNCVQNKNLFAAIRSGHIECVRSLTQQDPSLVNTTRDGCTVWEWAFESGLYGPWRRIADILLEVPGMDVDVAAPALCDLLQDAIQFRKRDVAVMVVKWCPLTILLSFYWRFFNNPDGHLPFNFPQRFIEHGYSCRTPELMRELHRRLRWGNLRDRGKPRVSMCKPKITYGDFDTVRERHAVHYSLDGYGTYYAHTATRYSVARMLVVISRRGFGETRLSEISTLPRASKISCIG